MTLGFSVAFLAGASTGTQPLPRIDDTLIEPTETVLRTFAAIAAYVVGSPCTATGTITDKDVAPSLRLGLVGTTVVGGGPDRDPHAPEQQPRWRGPGSPPYPVSAGGMAFDPLLAGTVDVQVTIPGFAPIAAATGSVTVKP